MNGAGQRFLQYKSPGIDSIRQERAREGGEMDRLYDKQADDYLGGRPGYPADWFSKFAALTPDHSLAWDVGTGNGQAAVSVAEHYDRVIATDVSEALLKRAIAHPRVKYIHTPLDATEEELIALLGGENSVDLITVAVAVHWFDLPKFYSVANRVLKKPGGIIAVWGYNYVSVNEAVDAIYQRFHAAALPYCHPSVRICFDEYRTLWFPFQSLGHGSEGDPEMLNFREQFSFDKYVHMLRSWSAVATAKERGEDLLHQGIVQELERAWGAASVIHTVTYKCFMLIGKPKLQSA